MTNSENPQGNDPAQDAAVEEIVSKGPAGTFAVAGLATAIVFAIFFVFYFFVFLPRGVVQ